MADLEDGRSFPIEGAVWPWGGWADDAGFVDPAPDEPEAERIQRMSTSGAPTIIDHDQVLEEDAAIASVDVTHVELDPDLFSDAPEPTEWTPAAGGGGGGGGTDGGGDSGCSTTSEPPGSWLWLLGGALLLGLGRRRYRLAGPKSQAK